jgi:hypothetical protein
MVEQGMGLGLVSEYSVHDTERSVRIPIRSSHASIRLAAYYLRAAAPPVVALTASLAEV